MVPGLFGFQSQALPYLIHSLIPEGSRLSAGLSPFLPLVCLLLRFVVLLLAMPSTTLPYIQPFAEFYFVLSDRLLEMPYRILCNGVQQEGAKLSPALASELFCYVPLHNIRYGVLLDSYFCQWVIFPVMQH